MREARHGFQGQEEDDEIKGEGNSVNYEYRMHDPRLGRFFAIDPLARKYPFWTPYAFSGNQVISTVELEGLEPEENPNENEKVHELKEVSLTPYVQGVSGDNIAMAAPSSIPGICMIYSNVYQANRFATAVGGNFYDRHGWHNVKYRVVVPRDSELGKAIIEKLASEHGINFKDLSRKEKFKLLSVDWGMSDDRSDLFTFRQSNTMYAGAGALSFPIALPYLVLPGQISTVEAGDIFVSVNILSEQLAGTFINQMSKVARGNQKLGEFEGWSNEEVQEEYENLSKKKLSKDEKALKQKLKTEKKARGLDRKQKKGSEKGVGTGRK